VHWKNQKRGEKREEDIGNGEKETFSPVFILVYRVSFFSPGRLFNGELLFENASSAAIVTANASHRAILGARACGKINMRPSIREERKKGTRARCADATITLNLKGKIGPKDRRKKYFLL